MGTASSSAKSLGAPINPRVENAKKVSKKLGFGNGKSAVIDSPVIVHLQHGTVRYRDEIEPIYADSKRREIPHEGLEISGKRGYFYHAELTDYNETAAKEKEDPFKFRFVTNGSINSRQKKVFYVYGIGMDAKDPGRIIKDPEPQNIGIIWPGKDRNPRHRYYKLIFNRQDDELYHEDEDINHELEDLEAGMSMNIELSVLEDNTIQHIKSRISIRIEKPIDYIHIAKDNEELSNHDIIGDLRNENEGSWKRFLITLNIA